ncbi:MAG: S8 family serine peptidase [Actinobacteria bacterium]|nr:S8 family serine peptidase [Actinomycetota bacterium]
MTDPRPLLAFPPPQTGPIPAATSPTPYRPVQGPSAGRQGTRLTPQFQTLRVALEAERAQLTEQTGSPEPELVAVFDLAGTVEAFMRAAALVDGLEFLSELQEDKVDADDDFFYEADGETQDDKVPQSLYMVMTNAQAVTELVRLFELWQEDQSITFERGLNPLKGVFGLLRAIRRWGPEDRVRETGLLEQWREDVAVGQSIARVEIELWYRDDPTSRTAAQEHVADIVHSSGGTVLKSSDQEAIAYHAVLADIPMSQVEQVLARGPEAIELLTTETVMIVSPSRPMTFPATEPTVADQLRFDTTLPEGRPQVGLLDGVPLANHVCLQGRLIVDDPDDRGEKYAVGQLNHGTSMASLIAHGDLLDPGPSLRQPIYVRPILEPHEHFREERVPPDDLLVDLVHRAFHRMFEGDGANDPAASSVRVVNLSVGDPTRVFIRRLSPLARLLDWLAHVYNLVIVVSAGNHMLVTPTLVTEDLSDVPSLQSTAARSLYERARHRRLLSPAEAINALTIGALHEDAAVQELPATVVDVIKAGTPASYSPVGYGFRRSVKPDVLLPGGRVIYQAPVAEAGKPVELDAVLTPATGPGLRVAAPGRGGELTGTSFTSGTSNAAALATRAVSNILDMLAGLTQEDGDFPFPDAQYHPALAKTLLVHASGWHDLLGTMRDDLGLSGQSIRRELTRLLGYGPVHPERIATADRVRAVLLGAGSINKDQRHSFRFPLPSDLSASTEWRRLTITLGWLSPVSVRTQKYRMARLKFTAPRDDLAIAPTEADANAVTKGTIQHQVLEGSSVAAFASGTSLSIDVDCRGELERFPSPVRYALAASLEVSPEVQIDVQAQVRTLLRAEVRERARAQVPAR